MCWGIGCRRSFLQNQGKNFKVGIQKGNINVNTIWLYSRKCFGPIAQHIFDPLSIILPQIDFMKDMVLAMRLITLLGGIVVFTNPQLFSSNVSNLMFVSSRVIRFHNTNFSGNLSVACNNICSTISGNYESCSIEPSKQKWYQANHHCNNCHSILPIFFVRPALYGIILGT